MTAIQVPDFRVSTIESERGWKTEYDYAYFKTLAEAKEFFDSHQPKPGRAPDYYYIAQRVETFDPMKKEWKLI